MKQNSLVWFNIGFAGYPQLVVNVYHGTKILVWHDTIGISRSLYLDIHRCTFTPLDSCICKFATQQISQQHDQA